MERVAFLVDDTGERIDCLLNPETFEVKRLAGVRPGSVTGGGQLAGTGRADDPVLFTGGGRTELVLDLIFDVELVETAARPDDVRALTRRLWLLAENSAEQWGVGRPPLVRLVWGKTWNVPGVVVSVAERFDAIDATGIPRRSWLRLKLVRVDDEPEPEQEFARSGAPVGTALPGGSGSGVTASVRQAGAVLALGDGRRDPGFSGVRFDLLAADATGDPTRWRELAEHNRIADPFDVPSGTVLAIPPEVAP